MRRTRALIAICALAFTSCVDGPSPGVACPSDRVLREGDRLPECTFPLITGGEMALDELEGRPTVLNFWASWCLACLKEMPELDRYAEERPDVRVLGVNTMINGETEAAGRAYFAERGVGYDSIVDPDGSFFGHFSGNKVLPLTVIVDEDLIIRARHFGELTAETLAAKVDEALD